MTNAKTILVLWSGGADSTCLIEQCVADPQYETVLAGYVYVANNEDKAASELAAIAKMFPMLAARGKFAYLGVLLQIHLTKTNPNLAFKQIPIWLLSLIEAVHPPVDEVALGYIRNPHPEVEDAASHLDDLQRIYAAYQPLMHRPLPRLVFPIAGLTKQEILQRISPELSAECVYCEHPVKETGGFRPCGKCRLCQQRTRDLADASGERVFAPPT